MDTVTCKLCFRKLKQHSMVRHFRTKHRSLFAKLQPLIRGRRRTGTGRKPYSCWRKYSTEISERKYRCNICQKVLNMPKAHGNMKRHIESKHPKVYKLETQIQTNTFKQWVNSEKSDSVSPMRAEDTEDAIELEEVVLEEEEYLDEYIEETYDAGERAVTVHSIDPDNEKDPIEEGEPCNRKDSMDEIDLAPKNVPASDTVESPIPIQEMAYQDMDNVVDYGDIEFISEKDREFEEKVKWLAERIVLGKRTFKTCIWNFFTEVDVNHIYMCIFCRKKIAIFPHSSSNLKRHLVKKHVRAFQIILKYGPEFKKKSEVSINKLLESSTPSDEYTKSFETSYFAEQGDNMYKCKSCDEVIKSDVPDSLVLFKHIHEKHSEEVISSIQDTIDDDEEFSVLFVKKKDLQLS